MDESALTGREPHTAEEAARAQREPAELVTVVWDALGGIGMPDQECLTRAKEGAALADALVDDLIIERIREGTGDAGPPA